MQQSRINDEPLLNVTLASLHQNERLISYNKTSTTYKLVRETLDDFSPAMYSTSPETMLRLVLLGRGHAVLPFYLVRQSIHNKKLSLLPLGTDGFARRPIQIIFRQRHKSMDVLQKQITDILHAQLKLSQKLVAPLFND